MADDKKISYDDNMVKWQKELEIFKKLKTCIIIQNNINDMYPYFSEEGTKFLYLRDYINMSLRADGYENIIFFNPVDGFYSANHSRIAPLLRSYIDEATGNIDIPEEVYKDAAGRDRYRYPICNLVNASRLIKAGMTKSNNSVVFVMELASRYCAKPDIMDQAERETFMNLQLATLNATGGRTECGFKKNILFMVVDKINDLPAWFYLNNPAAKEITVQNPDKNARRIYIQMRGEAFPGYREASEVERASFIEEFVNLTDGMKCADLEGLRTLVIGEGYSIKKINDAVGLYKYGVKENPWENLDKEMLKNAASIIKERVKGQDDAVLRTVDALLRAANGMSGLQHSSKSKPKAVLFFAGPTGTGKTELAKALTELIFGDERKCIRFDMSEYKDSHSDQKFFGAPPGYVGYDAGGQLTNAVKENPFSILLFDEIDKAHPSILDKFLQILEDGRMTDGQGNTVYFSETVIIFTSNLGVYIQGEDGSFIRSVSREDFTDDNDDPNKSRKLFAEMKKLITANVKDYFNLKLGRPEILNRIGDNIIVFNYITDKAAGEILGKQLDNIKDEMIKTKGITLEFDEKIIEKLKSFIIHDLEYGGRGIGNCVEQYVINTLSRYITLNDIYEGDIIRVNDIKDEDGVIELICIPNT